MSTDRQMAGARATTARDAATGMPVKPVSEMTNWQIFKSAFHPSNPLHQHNRRWGGARNEVQGQARAYAVRARNLR